MTPSDAPSSAVTPPPPLPEPVPRQVRACALQRVLVTGGAGFIGVHLCRQLLARGHDVICLDNFFTSQRANVLQLQRQYPQRLEVVRHDVTEPYACDVDAIYNLACPASPVHYQFNPIKTTKVSFLGALNVLGLAKRLHARVFQASTSEVYGDPEQSPQVESYLGNVDCTGVRACYDEGKRVAETLGIPHYVLDYESRFRKNVIEDFADAYARGETPIPCVRCNERVKFADLMDTARELGAAALATGHYVRRVEGEAGAEDDGAPDESEAEGGAPDESDQEDEAPEDVASSEDEDEDD